MPLVLLNILARLKQWWPWLRWVLAALAVIFAVLTFTQLADYLAARVAQHHLGKQVGATMQAHDDRQTAHQQAGHQADSAYYSLDGQRRESEARAATLKQVYDAQKASLPAAPVWPAQPPRP